MNVRRIAALLRELADEIERDAAPAPPAEAPHRKRELYQKKTPEGHARAAAALRRAGVYPSSKP